MTGRRLVWAVAAVFAASGCIETAVSAPERMVIACESFADALDASSERLQRDYLAEAEHWADLAARKDARFEFEQEALARLVQEADDELVDRDGRTVEDAAEQIRASCTDFVDADVLSRIRSGQLEIPTR